MATGDAKCCLANYGTRRRGTYMHVAWRYSDARVGGDAQTALAACTQSDEWLDPDAYATRFDAGSKVPRAVEARGGGGRDAVDVCSFGM